MAEMKMLPSSLASYSQRGKEGYPKDLEVLVEADFYRPGEPVLNAFEITYTPAPPGEDGKIKTFSIVARPKEYGERFWVSFYIDETGILRYTTEDRPATVQDPELEGF